MQDILGAQHLDLVHDADPAEGEDVLDAVGQQGEAEQEGEALVGVPEHGRVADAVHEEGQAVVDEFRRAWPPCILGLKVLSDLGGGVVKGCHCCGCRSIDSSAGQEVQNDHPILVGYQPVEISLPNIVCNGKKEKKVKAGCCCL